MSKAWKSEDISGKWAASSWAKRMEATKKRGSLNDFDRSVSAATKRIHPHYRVSHLD